MYYCPAQHSFLEMLPFSTFLQAGNVEYITLQKKNPSGPDHYSYFTLTSIYCLP